MVRPKFNQGFSFAELFFASLEPMTSWLLVQLPATIEL